jgi:hypothetical protein
MSTTPPTRRPDGSGRYEIRLQGRLDPRWSARFEGMTLTTGDGITLLEGHVADQAALHGLLHQLRDIGLPLVSVSQVEISAAKSPSHHPDTSTAGA